METESAATGRTHARETRTELTSTREVRQSVLSQLLLKASDQKPLGTHPDRREKNLTKSPREPSRGSDQFTSVLAPTVTIPFSFSRLAVRCLRSPCWLFALFTVSPVGQGASRRGVGSKGLLPVSRLGVGPLHVKSSWPMRIVYQHVASSPGYHVRPALDRWIHVSPKSRRRRLLPCTRISPGPAIPGLMRSPRQPPTGSPTAKNRSA